MRRLLLLVCAVVLVDTMLYAALAPLLPRYVDELGLSKGSAGLLVAAYATGVLVGALPGGIAATRWGAKRAVLAGLVIVAAASIGFGLADGAWTLGLSRLLQGIGSALSWAGAFAWLVAGTPRHRRGEMLGSALGAAIFGALLGPAVGAAADVVGAAIAFGGVAVACAFLLVWALRTPGFPGEPVHMTTIGPALRERRLSGGLYLMTLPALFFGLMAVLIPLRLDDHGWDAVAIGALFIAAAAIEAVIAPLLGRASDRRGRRPLIRAALVGSVVVSIALAPSAPATLTAVIVLAASVAYGAFFAPAMALISEGAERAGLAQALAFGLMNGCWAIGNTLGPAVGGALAERAGDALPFLLAAALGLLTLVAARSPRLTAARSGV